MKSKKSSPWLGAGIGCLAGAIFSILAIALLSLLGVRGDLIRVISYLPYVTAIAGFIIYNNRQTQNELETKQNPPDLGDKVLELFGKGLSNSEISENLGVSAVQVSLAKSELMKKFNFSSDSELMEEAGRRGFVPDAKPQDTEASK